MGLLESLPDDVERKSVMEMSAKNATEKMRVRTDSCILRFV